MARIRVKKGLAEITSNDTHKAFTVGSIDGYNESWDEAGFRKHARMSLEVADYLRELTAKGYKEDYKKAYLNDSNMLDSVIKYKGYSIEKDFYGKGEYTVQYQGDDVVFKSVEEAKEFINEISDSFNDAKVYASGDRVKAKLPSGHIEEFTVNKDLGSEIEVIEKTNSGKPIKYTINKSQIVLDSTQVNDEKYPKGVHNRSTLEGEYNNGTIWYDGDGFYALNGSGNTKWFPTIEEAYKFVDYVKDSTMFKVTDKKTGKVRLVRAIDSLEAIGKVVNISNLRGKNT